MNDTTLPNQTQGSENETHAAETHAPWQLEKDTEGLDAPQQSETSGTEEEE